MIDYFKTKFIEVRRQTLNICSPLKVEDYVVQPVVDVSPPKWHLGHTTWFFETFILIPNKKGYKLFDEAYGFVFNSYYETVGNRVLRTDRGNLSRPSVEEVYQYRAHVEAHMLDYFNSLNEVPSDIVYVLELGLQHEQQHQELLLYDIKYILGHNPLFPAYKSIEKPKIQKSIHSIDFLKVEKGNYQIGHDKEGFCFDNEKGVHTIHLHNFEIADRLISNEEYLEFIEAGGYQKFQYWFSEAWGWINDDKIKSPMYWHNIDGEWHYYTLGGLKRLDLNEPVAHISMYEADAFSKWKNMRLPTEFEWEVACKQYHLPNQVQTNFVESELFAPTFEIDKNQFLGNLWEWTNSAYLSYPYFKTDGGAIGEYNGKFMINQMVLKGGSYASPLNHIRPTYRNFFHPHLQWQFSGIRLARDI